MIKWPDEKTEMLRKYTKMNKLICKDARAESVGYG